MSRLIVFVSFVLQMFGVLAASQRAVAQDPVALGVGAVENLGGGLSGTAGVPSLNAVGTFSPGQEVTIELSGARPNSVFYVVAGTWVINLPIFGGVLIPNPEVIVSAATNGQGACVIPLMWSIPQGITYFQVLVEDPLAIQGIAMSNAISVRSGPQDLKQGGLVVGTLSWNNGLVKGFRIDKGPTVTSWAFDSTSKLYTDGAGNTASHDVLPGGVERITISAGSQHAGIYYL